MHQPLQPHCHPILSGWGTGCSSLFTVLQLDRIVTHKGLMKAGGLLFLGFFYPMLSCNLLFTEPCRWVLHVQLLFLLCDIQKTKRFVVFWELLMCFCKLKNKPNHTFSKYLTTVTQGDKNHTLVEKYWWEGTSGGVSIQIAVQNSTNSKARSCCSELCPADFWITSRTEVWQPPWEIRSSDEASSTRSTFSLHLIRVYHRITEC